MGGGVGWGGGGGGVFGRGFWKKEHAGVEIAMKREKKKKKGFGLGARPGGAAPTGDWSGLSGWDGSGVRHGSRWYEPP